MNKLVPYGIPLSSGDHVWNAANKNGGIAAAVRCADSGSSHRLGDVAVAQNIASVAVPFVSVVHLREAVNWLPR
ncbi:MAG TPA: hypothetical protein VKF40_06255 [Burkholderiales bacterium]|nr:hypothetical protein [Burkholderiales bacterium]